MAKRADALKTQDQAKRKSKPYPIVAIGASAGGLEAISELLKNLPPDTGMAYVYVQHLDPTHKSMLSEILQRTTKMKVVEARHLLHIQPNHVFIIPPNKDMAIIDGVLTLNPRKAKPDIHLPIDNFFSSLADKQKEGAIGIVLSGNASDGTFGLKTIKQAGGITFAQNDSAKFQSMPHSAIAEGVVDMVLSPKEIAKELERISKHPAIIPDIAEEKPNENDIHSEDEDLLSIIQLLRKATGVDFFHYKMNTIKRRIIRRMLIYKLDTLGEYNNFLKQNAGEINVLYQDILINVTSFFRDADAMEYVKKTLIPRILKSRNQNESVRVWVPACATGEEAYSLGMLFMEVLGDRFPKTQVQIFATDLSEYAIGKARIGFYTQNDLAAVSPERVKRFFEKIDGGYRIIKSIRDLCVFANHNVFRDPPFSRLDLISCCNLMIYLDAVLQKKVMAIFHYALTQNGFLILGKSEAITTSPQLFSQIEKKYKIYARKKDSPERSVFDISYRWKDVEKTGSENLKKTRSKKTDSQADFEKEVDAILLKDFVPASVVVNNNLEILQFHGSTGLYLEHSQGKANFSLLKMARAGLSYDLRNAVHKAGKTGERIKRSGLEIKVKDQPHKVSIEVVPLPSEAEEPLFLVVFSEMTSPASTETKSNYSKDKLAKQLQEELVTAKEDMHSIIEEQEASVEELQSANEEIISSNEELQSINEELETSKEEIESANEELQTINSELQVRNEQLSESHEYSEAVFETLGEAVLVLDKELRVKTANQSFYKIFGVSHNETEGMLLFELGSRQWNTLPLRELLEEVFSKGKTFRDFEISHDFPGIGQKTMLLNARSIIQEVHRQQLIILTIRDITEHRLAEKIIREQEARFRNMANNVPVMIWTTGVDRACNFVNTTWLQFTGKTMESALGKGWLSGLHKDDSNAFVENYFARFAQKESFKSDCRLKRNDGEYRWVNIEGKPNYSAQNEFIGYIGSCVEIHDKKIAHEETEKIVEERTIALNEAIENLNYSNTELEQFAYVASHDLQEPLRKIITFADKLSDATEEPEHLGKIISSAERMRKLINELLHFSKTSKSEKSFKKTDLNETLKDVLLDLDLLVEEKHAKIVAKPLPVVRGIPLQLHQLFYNLIGNAIKFSSDDKTPNILIDSRKLPANDLVNYPQLNSGVNYVEIMVKDNGIGFEPEFAEQIFTIFQRLHDSEKYSGSGIGLALCRKIVMNHKGLIFAESTPNIGSAFHIILPESQ